MKVGVIVGAVLLLTGCGSDYYNVPDSGNVNDSLPDSGFKPPIYRVDSKRGEFKQDLWAERIREQGSVDGSTDQGATFGW